MAQQTVNIGTLPNDGTGDPLRNAYDKINDNFDELYGTTWRTFGESELTSDVYIGADVAGNSYTLAIGVNQGNDRPVANTRIHAADSISLNSDFAISFNAVGGITSNNKHQFTTTSTLAAINLFSTAGNPTTLTNFDMWGNSSTSKIMARVGGQSVALNANYTHGLSRVGDDVGIGNTSAGVNPILDQRFLTIGNGVDTSASLTIHTSPGFVGPSIQLIGSAGGTGVIFISNSTSGFQFLGDATINNRRVVFSDGRSPASRKGIEYDADYTASFVTRSLVDKGYVDNNPLFWKTSGTTTLLGAVTIAGGFRTTFSPNATLEGLNVGGFAGTPANPSNGGLWYNTSTNNLMGQISSGPVNISFISTANLGSNRIPFYQSSSLASQVTSSAFTFTSSTNTLQANRVQLTSTTTLPAISIAAVSGNPSTLVDGDIWHSLSVNDLLFRANGGIRNFMSMASPVATRVPFVNVTGSGLMDHSANFTYNTAAQTLAVNGYGAFVTNATRAAIGLGNGITGDPSSTNNFDIWASTSSGGSIRTKINSVIENIPTVGATASGRVAIFNNAVGQLTSGSNFTFISSTLNTPNIAITGTLSADGSVGTAGYVLTSNGASPATWQPATPLGWTVNGESVITGDVYIGPDIDGNHSVFIGQNLAGDKYLSLLQVEVGDLNLYTLNGGTIDASSDTVIITGGGSDPTEGVTLQSASGRLLLRTASIDRLKIDSAGAWTLGADGVGTSGQVLTSNGAGTPPTWENTGNVVGPGSVTDNAIVRFDGTTGKVIQNSLVTINDSGQITTVELSISGLPASFGILFNNAGIVDNEGAFTYNPTGNVALLQDGTFAVANSSTSANTTIRTGDIRIDSDGDSDFTTYNETGITTPSVGNYTITATSATLNLVGNLVQINGNTVETGSYTPVASNLVNISDITFNTAIYLRVGSWVNVSGTVNINPVTTGLNSSFSFPIPVGLNFSDLDQAFGNFQVVYSAAADKVYGTILASVGAPDVSCSFVATSVAADRYTFSFWYSIQ